MKDFQKIRVVKYVIEDMCAPWKDALVVCLLGSKLRFRTMKSKLNNFWKVSSAFDLMDIDHGFFMVKLDLASDKDLVIGGGPHMVFDHYLVVSTWSIDFIAPGAKVTKTLAWIHIPGLNPGFYGESFVTL